MPGCCGKWLDEGSKSHVTISASYLRQSQRLAWMFLTLATSPIKISDLGGGDHRAGTARRPSRDRMDRIDVSGRTG